MSNGLLLWVDDEIELLKAHIIFLEKKGYEVVTVSNGADAIEQCSIQTFDLVLLDEQMPGLSGLETLQRMKEIQPATPIVMVTKSEEENIMNQAIGAKIADYLIKPVNPSQILLTLKKNIHRREIVTEVAQTGYQQEYQQLTMQISNCRDFNDWVEVYKKLVKWELELSSADSNMTEMLTMQKEDANIRMKDGSYQGIGMGFKGNVRVEVKVTDGKIASINVIDNIDDAPFFDKAKSLIPNIISSQTANVDSVSGATYSSNGIKSAVRDALKKAGSSQESVNNDEINKKLEKLSKLEEKLKQMKKLSKDLRKKVESLEAESQKYIANKKLKDGSYEGSGIGFRGYLKVEVDVNEGKISSIRVVENVDDAPYFEKARGLITNIVSGQTPNVDSVSGATYSSNGIKSAVRDALKKAYIEEEKSDIQSENDKLKKAIEENEKVENEIKALREENTSLKEKNTLLMSIIDSLKKKIHGIAYGDLTKELYDSFISVLNSSDGLNTGKEN